MTTSARFPSRSRFATSEAFFNAVYRWMLKRTGRELYRHFKTGEVVPTAAELADWLNEQTWPKISKFVPDYQTKPTKGEWSGEQYERQLERAVSFCLDGYDPERIYNRASKGGKVGAARKATFTLAAFRALPDGLSVAEQMAAMGCSESQIYALRAKNKTYDPVLGGEFDFMTTIAPKVDRSHGLLDGDSDSAA